MPRLDALEDVKLAQSPKKKWTAHHSHNQTHKMKPKPKTKKAHRIGTVKILKPREFKSLLRNATPQTLPAFVLGGFCGLRMAEIQELRWENMDFKTLVVVVEGGKYPSSKRIVPLPDAAVAWLTPVAKNSGRVMEGLSVATLTAEILCVWKEARCVSAPHRLRYSAAAYRYSLDGGTKTAREFGFSLKMLIDLFKNLVRKRQAKRWFAIFPPNQP